MRVLALLIFAMTVATRSANPAWAAEKQKAIVLTQTSAALGRTITYVSSTAVRVNVERGGSYLVASAPRWKVVMFNPTDKLGFEMDYEQYLRHAPQFTYIEPSHRRPIDSWPKLRAGVDKYAGVECSKFVVPRDPRSRSAEKSEVVGYFLTLERQSVPKQICLILDKFFFQPPLPGIPLQEYLPDNTKAGYSFLDLRGNYSVLSTSLVREEDCSADLFRYPVSFKKVPREIDVISDSSRRKELEDLTKDMGVGK
jgi:hypothetical protein